MMSIVNKFSNTNIFNRGATREIFSRAIQKAFYRATEEEMIQLALLAHKYDLPCSEEMESDLEYFMLDFYGLKGLDAIRWMFQKYKRLFEDQKSR